MCVCVCWSAVRLPRDSGGAAGRPTTVEGCRRGGRITRATEDKKEFEGEELGVGAESAGRRTLSWLTDLAVLRRSVRPAGWGAVGTVGSRGCGSDAVVIVAICLLSAVVSWSGVSWPRCVVAVLCGGLLAGAVLARWVAAVCAGCGCASVLKGGFDLVCSLLLGWVLGGAFGVILVPPSYLLLKFLAALRLSCVREVEGSGRGAASAVRLL